MSGSSLPANYKAVVSHEYGKPPKVETLSMPEAIAGSVVVKVLAAECIENIKHVLLNPANPYFSNPTPYTPGTRAIGRVAAVGPDAVSLQVGQLVMTEPFVRGRDEPDAQILAGLFDGPTPTSKKLTKENLWRNGTWTEYSRVPLENCYALNEKLLLGKPEEGGLGYDIPELLSIVVQIVPYGGFRAINLQAGETIIIAPATGHFGGAAVEVASAMGATVIAVGRDSEKLKKMADSIPRVHPVVLTGDDKQDVGLLSQFGTVDAVMDFTPATMTTPIYLQRCVAALKPYGRVVLMGFPHGELSLNYTMMVIKNITLKAQYMYERDEVKQLIKLVEKGQLRIGKTAGKHIVGQYKLDDWEKAINHASEASGWGGQVVFTP